MSKHDSSLSKDQYNLLKDLKSKLVILSLRLNLLPLSWKQRSRNRRKTSIYFASRCKAYKNWCQQYCENWKISQEKVDAQTLAKRAAAEGPMHTDETVLSDTQAMLNPVGSQASLSYRIATLQHKVLKIWKREICVGSKLSTCMVVRSKKHVRLCFRLSRSPKMKTRTWSRLYMAKSLKRS